jgi:hypothetical protein
LTDTANWKTSNGIGFSLTPTAKCSISIDTVSEVWEWPGRLRVLRRRR